ncbi:histidine phosphotransferase family protein [Tropicimonas sp. IMCC6043]|uniref:histidine phosphotransferase family protein n=1 Tax=Tropicimonas sp. IMCC6043 TaxID=2510645 RepID=UPI00101D51BD|nr:histidine phosphotransferase family protein [Tropicimonas sp. IMCC6043]RYH10416.1 histidine phosphotransferase [Tropicimonas sp. IMCC6043]
MSSDDPQDTPDIAALVGSRICHDLISPIGAIGNGLELFSMSGGGSAEIALISDSVANANARIRFFRVAFGLASPDQGLARSEILGILKDVYGGTRLRIDWGVGADCRRQEVKAVFLALQCLENALPYGGEIAVSRANGIWHLTGRSKKLKYDPQIWSVLTGSAPEGLAPKTVHFALLPDAVCRLGRRITLHSDEACITLSF